MGASNSVTSLGHTCWALLGVFCRLGKRVLEAADIGQRRAQVGDYAGTTSLLDAVWCAVGRCVVRCLTQNSEQSESPYLPKSECPTMDAASAASMGGHTEVGMRACDFDLLKAGCPRNDAASAASDGRHHGFSLRACGRSLVALGLSDGGLKDAAPAASQGTPSDPCALHVSRETHFET